MCFRIDSNKQSVLITRRPKYCYKIVRRHNQEGQRYKNGKYKAYYRRFWYQVGKTYIVAFFGISQYRAVIHEGLHSYSTYKKAFNNTNGDGTIIKCVIPTGTEYYYNRQDKEYVSLALKVIKEV